MCPSEPDRRDPSTLDRRVRTRGGRRQHDIGLRDPDACPEHGSHSSYVMEPIKHKGYIERRHSCRMCGAIWVSYQSLIDPKRIKRRPA